ncbi:MAG: heme biosynthesis protein HemY [Rhodospirillaceae bacterium]|nr:heme biosynthesis protein HemY [Rhodospirillaceae bacterium]
MIRAFWFLTVIALISLGGALVADNPGAVSLDWLGYHIDMSIGFMIFAVLILALLLATIFRIWSFFRKAPRRLGRVNRNWRRRRGYKALTQGMFAIAAGDAQEAKRQSKKAENLLAEPPLTMLLSAQAAQLSGDDKAASKFFEKMSERKETKYLGLHGKLNQAMQEGDQESALELAEQASDLNSKTDTVTRTLFELQIKGGNWIEAEETIRKLIKNKLVDVVTGRRRRAILIYQQGVEAENEGRLGDALQLVRKANNLAPGFVPAAVRAARLMQRAGKRRKAASVIEETWVKNPHPHLAEVMENLAPGAGGQEKTRALEKLANYNKDHVESHIAIGRAALASSMWLEAREHLEAAKRKYPGDIPSARICRYLAELEEAENQDVEASREWLKMAADGDPDSAWICSDCGNVVAEWEPVCERCENFDSFEWQVPPRVSRLTATSYASESDDPEQTTIDPEGKPIKNKNQNESDAGNASN